ncbi:sugar transferase [Sphingosinicella sp. CPCC 101087]|uniref:sugar transferase n=1 Tax=Sphingosinicella sp. CPCC 101087 TaxID=2497754 RepID=UPI00101E1EC9|nr:sugar transferase [Sphingosinicella sp. CPCC 101087]
MNAYVDSVHAESGATPLAPRHEGHVRLPNKQRRRIGLYILIAAVDAAAITAALVFASLLQFGHPIGWQSSRLTGIIIPLFFAMAISRSAYSADALTESPKGAMRAVLSLCLATAIALLTLHQLDLLDEFSGWIVAYGVGLAVPFLMLGRTTMAVVSSWALENHPVIDLVIADGVPVRGGRHQLVIDAPAIGISADVSNPMMLDRVGKLLKNVDRVTIACMPEREEDWKLIIKGAGVTGEVRAANPALQFSTDPVDIFGDRYAMFPPPSLQEIAMKRLMDLALVIPGLIFVAPLLAIIAIAIKLDSPGPVLFVQERIGRGNRLFRMYKFRSMRTESCDGNGNMSTRRDDDRITRVGRWLRATSMDELPQLFNVLFGSMSLVGPRPHALGSTASEKLFWDIDRRYWLRHACAPGLTGLAQVRGFRGATHHRSDLEARLAADLEYMRTWSLWLDVKILLRTFGVVIHRNAF